jgi:hypothetical protein
MYEQWRLRRWDTPVSDAKNLFMDSLHDHAGGLEMEFGDYFNNVATARYRVTFRKYAAYRNIDESCRLELWNRRQQLNDPTATGWTFVVPESPWVQEFVNEPILELFNPGIVHYLIATENDVVEVMSNEDPAIERLDRFDPLSTSTRRYFAARRSAFSARCRAYFFSKRSTRPAVSINFCLPVKNGWQLEQISTRMSPLWVERVLNVCPQAQITFSSL